MKSKAQRWLLPLIIVLVGVPSVLGQELVDPPPGTYRGDRALVANEALEYRFLDPEGEPHTPFFIPFDGPVYLTASPGVERRYRLEIRRPSASDESETAAWTIDRRAPSAPDLDPLPGVFSAPVSVSASTDEPDATILMRLDVGVPAPRTSVQLDGRAGEIVDYIVFAQATDGSGNTSGATEHRYRVDRRDERPYAGRAIVSPVAGMFANEQLLLIRDDGLTDVSLMLRRDGVAVDVPSPGAIIREAGTYNLELRAQTRDGSGPIVERVEWTQATVPETVSSGVYHASIVIPRPDSAYRYTLEDRPVTVRDPMQLQSITLALQNDASRIVTVRRLSGDGELRSVFVLDGTRPPPPVVSRHRGRLLAYSLTDSEIVYAQIDAEAGVPSTPPSTAVVLPDDVSSLELSHDARYAFWARRIADTSTLWSTATVMQGAQIVDRADVPVVVGPPRVSGRIATLVTDGPAVVRIVEDGEAQRWFEVGGTLRLRFPRGYVARVGFDVAGSLAAATSGQTERLPAIDVATAPPAPPAISSAGTTVRLDGSGEVFYRIDGGTFARYSEPISLDTVAGARVTYVVEAYAVQAGEVSPTARETISVDQREVLLPPLEAPFEGTRIVNAATVELVFANPYDDLLIHYDVTQDGRSSIPSFGSETTNDRIVIETPAGSDVTYSVAARARFDNTTRWSSLERFSIRVDRSPPAIPVILTPSEDQDRTSAAILEFEESEAEARIWYRTSGDEAYRPYVRPVTLDAPIDGITTYEIEAYAEDTAGNRTFLAEPRRVTIRTAQPKTPVILANGRPLDGSAATFARGVIVEVSGNEQVLWRIVPEDDSEAVPYRAFDGGQPLQSDGANAQTWLVEAYASDVSGNRSATARIRLTIDPDGVTPPPPPTIVRTGDGRQGRAVWGDTTGLFAAVNGQGGFAPVEGPLTWTLPANALRGVISYYRVSEAGVRSATETLTVEVTPEGLPPAIEGVADGAVYRESVDVTLTGDAIVRYTVTLDGTPPPIVHPLSAVADGALRFEAAEGEAVTVQIRARSEIADGVLGPESRVTFALDRLPPAAPRLAGVENGAYYSDSVTAEVVADETDQLFVAVEANDGSDAPSPFRSFRGQAEIALAARRGELVEYRLRAYTVDAAGNRSQTTETWSVFVDQEIVYVDGAAPEDGDGSRTRPYRSLDDAIARVRETNRRTIFLTGGAYSLSDPRVALNGGRLAIVGGLEGAGWTPRPTEASSVSVSGGEAPSSPLEIEGALALRNLALDAHLAWRPRAPGDTLLLDGIQSTGSVHVDGGAVEFRSVRAPGAAVSLTNTTAEISSSAIGTLNVAFATATVDASETGRLVAADSALSLRDVRVTDDGELAVDLLRSAVDMAGVRVTASSTAPVVGLRVSESRLEMRESTISASSTSGAIALRARASSVRTERSIIESAGDQFTFGVVSRDSDVDLGDVAISVRGGTETVAVVASGSTAIRLVHGVIAAVESADPRGATAVNAASRDSTVTIANTILWQQRSERDDPTGVPAEAGTSGLVRQRFDRVVPRPAVVASGVLSMYGSAFSGWEDGPLGATRDDGAASWLGVEEGADITAVLSSLTGTFGLGAAARLTDDDRDAFSTERGAAWSSATSAGPSLER